MTNHELTSGLVRDDENTFAFLMARYRLPILSLAPRMLRDREEAEDMVQIVFLEAYRLRQKFDPNRGTVGTWVMQLAYTRTVNRLHHLASSKVYQALELDEFHDHCPSSRSLDSRLDTRQRIETALASLNESQRRVILLFHSHGYSLREIAEQTGQPFPQVRHHFYRGLEKIRHKLEDRDW